MAIALAFLAGLWTTLAGLGGGMMLLFGLAAWWGDPVAALAVTAPALLVGNVHRLLLFRDEIDGEIGRPLVLGTFPGALLGGFVAVAVPVWLLQLAMIGVAVLALTRVVGLFSWRPGVATLVPVGAAIGAVGATAGGAGVLVGPVLLSSGLSGARYVATGAVIGVTLHAGRCLAYGLGGWLDPHIASIGLALAVSITVGNAVGKRVRAWIPEGWQRRLELGTAIGLIGLAVVGATA